MRIVAIDLSYRKPVALAWLDNAKTKRPDWCLITPEHDIYSTVVLVCDWVEGIFKLAPKEKDKLLVVETPLMIRNMNTAYVMARMHGMLEFWSRNRMHCRFFGIHPRTWQSKTFKVEEGENLKTASIRVATDLVGNSPKFNGLGEDEADAINMCMFARKNYSQIMRAISGGGKFSEK